MHGKIVGDTYIKYEDEKQKMRMCGGAWSIKLDELTEDVKNILYITEKGEYRTTLNIAIAKGFPREFQTKNGSEIKQVVPLKSWNFKQIHKEKV